MRRLIKQGLSALLAVVMLLTLCPAPPTRAADETAITIFQSSDGHGISTAMIDSRTYGIQHAPASYDTENGRFRVFYELRDTSDTKTQPALNLALKDKSWDWYDAPFSGSEVASEGKYYIDFPLKDISSSGDFDISTGLTEIGIKVPNWDSNGHCTVDVASILYYASETDETSVELVSDQGWEPTPYANNTVSSTGEIAAVKEHINEYGYFAIEYQAEKAANLALVLEPDWTTVQPPADGNVEISAGSYCAKIPQSSCGAYDFTKLEKVGVQIWDGGEGMSSSVKITKITYNYPSEGGEEPDPGPGDDDGIKNNGWLGEGAYVPIVTKGGYFHIEFPYTTAPENVTLIFQGDNDLWKAISPSERPNGTVRQGDVEGKTGVYYAEFAYSDCVKAVDLTVVKNILVQVNYQGIGKDNPAGAKSVTIKYYPNDPTPPSVAGQLDTTCVAIGTAVTASLESGTGSTYQWYRVVGNATENGDAISGATNASYTPTNADKGYWIYCVIDSKTIAGPAAVVVSKTNKTIELPLNADSKTIAAGGTGNIAAVPDKVMLTPGGQFKLTFESSTGSVDFVLNNSAWNGWTAISKTVSGATELTVSFDEIESAWSGNVASIKQIQIKNNGSSPLKITKLEWIGPDVGMEEAPYQPTSELPFGGDTWKTDWNENAHVTENEGKNRLEATIPYDGGEWSVTRLQTHSDTGFIVGSNNMVSLNVYIEKAAMDAGKGEMLFQIVDQSSEFTLNTSGEENTVTVDGKVYYRTALNIPVTFPARFNDFILAIRGKNSKFNGTILVENIILRESEGEKTVEVAKNVPVTGGTATVTVSSNKPSAFYGDAVKVTLALDAQPSADVKVSATLNDKVTTEEVTIPAGDFKQAAARSASYVATAEVPVPCTVGQVTKIKVDVTGAPANSTMTLNKLTIVNKIPQLPPAAGGGGGGGVPAPDLSQITVKLPHTWSFDSRTDGWKYDKGWNNDYSGTSNTQTEARGGRLAVEVDYSKDGDKGWSQIAITLWHDYGMTIQYATHASLDLYYQPEKLDGALAIKLYSGGAGIDTEGTFLWDEAEDVKIGRETYRKVPVTFHYSPIAAAKVQDMALCIIGRNTTYKGTLLIDDLTIDEAYAGSYVTSTRQPKAGNSTLSLTGRTLTTASGEQAVLPSQVVLADGKADASVRALYAYLQAMGESQDVLFGQQYNFGKKAGSADLSDSDTYDVVGDYAAVFGLDTLSLSGSEFTADECNKLYGTNFPSTAEGHVVAAAYLTNLAIKRGAIVTLSSHMPNFSQVQPASSKGAATYARYDFSGYTPNVLSGDTANEILPGGKYHAVFTAYLDMIADYAKRVKGAVLFRPFHENTGSWFWWGKAFCDAETYKNIYRYTVEYLRDEKGVHNLLYIYGPGSEAETQADYAERYPGDSWVDMVGFDMYNTAPDPNSGWMASFEKELALVSQFAQDHGKLVAVTETGAANATVKGDSQTALLRTGNKDLDWYRRIQEIVSKSPASYLLVWANFGQSNGFYTPYVIRTSGSRLYGHEMMDHFIDYYNDSRSIFASDQKEVLTKIAGVTAKAASVQAEGYITAPVSGRRILEATVFTARVTNAKGAAVQFVLHSGDKTVTLTAKSAGGAAYTAQLSKADLESLGECADGSAELLVGGKSQQTIRLLFNIAAPALERKLADDFDTYYGVDALLNKTWTVNSGTGCSLTASLDQTVKDVGTALRLSYSLVKDGYAGVSRSRETDWSGCNALRFWTVPDGKGQKVVVQITANGQIYEAYLDRYDAYRTASEPLLVTIPFAEFVQRDAEGQPKGGLVRDCKKISGVGLWVNAVGSAPVSGTLWYDSIAAIENGPSQVTIVPAGGRFKDVPATAWYFAAVEYAAEHQLMSGVGSGLFAPDNTMTRAMMVQVLYNMAGRPAVSAGASFQDVAKDAWYADAVAWASSKGIVTGYSAATFGPEDQVTREQMAVMLWKYAKSKGVPVSAEADLSGFADAGSISAWALEAVRWANGEGLLNGVGNKSLAPGGSATRAQLATILMRYQQKG